MADAVYIPRLKRTYDETIRQALTEQFGYKNQMEVPVLDKIVLNMGVGETVADGKKINSAVGDLTLSRHRVCVGVSAWKHGYSPSISRA